MNWRPIKDFEPYEVSIDGRVRNGSTMQELGIHPNHSGVYTVVIRRNNKAYCRAVNRLVANAWISEEDQNYIPMHIDYDKSNNHADNLVWKPRGFALEIVAQHKRRQKYSSTPIRNLSTGVVYPNAKSCAEAILGLEYLVLNAADSRGKQSYMGDFYEYV